MHDTCEDALGRCNTVQYYTAVHCTNVQFMHGVTHAGGGVTPSGWLSVRVASVRAMVAAADAAAAPDPLPCRCRAV